MKLQIDDGPAMEVTTPASRGTKPVAFFHFVHDNEQYTVHVMAKKNMPVARSEAVRELDELKVEDMVFRAQPLRRHSFQLAVNRHVKSANPCNEMIVSGAIHCIVDEYPTYCDASIEQVLFYENGEETWPKLMVNKQFQPLLVWLEQLLNIPAVQQVVIVPPPDLECEWNVF